MPSARCPRCGDRSPTTLDALFCCVLCPDPRSDGACSWCGEDLPDGPRGRPRRVANVTVERRVFCGKRCSQDYQDDASGGALSPFARPDGGGLVASTRHDGQRWEP